MSVEVERKFVCNADTPLTLEKIGAVCVGQRQIQDQYFDTPSFDLTLQDLWLRKRKGCWELKCPTIGKAKDVNESDEASLCTRYAEITNLTEIQMRVMEVLKANDPEVYKPRGGTTEEEKATNDGDSWLARMNLRCFADFTTERQSFTLEEEGVQIDLDHADFGYHVGEIEVLLAEGGDVQTALERIERTARKLGLSGHQRVEGKMNVYLRKNHPEQYATLLRAHIL